jgi:hypothetical protein
MNGLNITFVVSSESSERLRQAKQLAADEVRSDNVLTDIGRAKDKVVIEHHRVGDYFASVQIADSSPTSFRLVFAPAPNADRYWKDIVVKIISSIKGAGVLVRSER